MKEVLYNWLGYNTEIFYLFNHAGNIWFLPKLLRCLSWLFNIENFAIYYLLLCGICYYRIFIPHKKAVGKALVPETDFWLIYNKLVYVGICYAVFGLTYAALKFSVNMPRPFCSLPPDTFETIINTADERCMSSFPSSHSGLALMVTLLAWQHIGAYAKAWAIIITIMVAFSRLTFAMHYPADILYSYLIVSVVMSVSCVIFKLFEHNLIKYIGRRIL